MLLQKKEPCWHMAPASPNLIIPTDSCVPLLASPVFCLCLHMFCLLNSSRFLGPRDLEKPHLVDFFQALNDSTEMANLTDAGGNLRSLEVLPCF